MTRPLPRKQSSNARTGPLLATPLVLGDSPASRALARDLERVSAGEVTVLVQGESGVGKSLIARELHHRSSRAAGPLVEIALAALAPPLLEAELFGHEEGAFTGAQGRRPGRIRQAHGGTLVLDGIEVLPRELQAKLLRVLQEREVEPLGAEEAVPVDLRVVATSTRDLQTEVSQGEFREDLYYRLAVVKLDVPPLRGRGEDLDELADALLERAASRVGVQPRALDGDARARLAAHPWPGNVRELENALERALVLAGAAEAGEQPEALRAEDFAFLGDGLTGAAERLAREALAQGLSLDELEGAMLVAALAEQRGNMAAAARQAGLSRRAFEYRLRKATSTEGEEEHDEEPA